MAIAVCTGCGKHFHWYGGRGRRLADIVSPCCNAKAKGKPVEHKWRERRPYITAHVTHFNATFGTTRESDTRITLTHAGRIRPAGDEYSYTLTDKRAPDGSLVFECQWDYCPRHRLTIAGSDWLRLKAKEA